jgi:DNA-binding NarL/FixJ family response regulator
MTSEIRLQIIDDQQLIGEALAALLERSPGVRGIHIASNLADALAAAASQPPDLFLVDVLPQPTFFEELSELRWPRTEWKIVLLDDCTHDAHAREALRLQLTGYLTRQQPFQQIEAAIRQAARGEKVYAPEIAQRLVFTAEGVRLALHEHGGPLANLTPREMDVFIYIARGYSVKRCAAALGISSSTVDNHKSRLMKKLNIHKNVELAQLAMREGLDLGCARNRPVLQNS